MFHELLVALYGCPGSLFTETENRIEVIPNLPSIHPNEVKTINELCTLGLSYKKLKQFIQNYENLQYNSKGIYLQAFCHGLQEVLQSYAAGLIDLEAEIIRGECTTITRIHGSLLHHFGLLHTLQKMVEDVNKSQTQGIAFVDLINKHSVPGVPVIRDAMGCIDRACIKIVYKQLATWLLYGILVDPHSEFFIRPFNPEKDSLDQQPATLASPRLANGYLLTMRTCQVLYSYVPSFISFDVADAILFIGEAVKMYDSESMETVPENKIKKKEKVERGSAFGDRRQEFANKLQEILKVKEQRQANLETLVQTMRACVAERLWHLLMEDFDLVSHLKIIKDYFLLARGELYHVFIDQANRVLSSPPSPNTESDVNIMFQLAARALLLDEQVTGRLHFILPETPDSSQTGWEVVGLTYDVQWPLHVLFNADTLKRYSQVFHFLLSVKRAQLEVNKCWPHQMQTKNKLTASQAQVWQLRVHLAFLIDNLQYYLQVDVLETQYTTLLNKLASTRDFEAIYTAHENFLSSCLNHCFISHKSICDSLHELFELSHSFSCFVLKGISDPLTPEQETRMQDYQTRFNRNAYLLVRLLSAVKKHEVTPYLGQLVLRLDYNKYFSTCGSLIVR